MNIKQIVCSLILLSSMLSCKVEPRPIDFGKDTCEYCRMVLMDPKFGSEIVTSKGKVFIFDDVNCLHDYIASEELIESELAHIMVVDFHNMGKLIPLDHAHFVFSEEIKSPMASRVAAFGEQRVSEEYREKWNGQLKTWEELKNMFE
jgi:copper chaperone NosL